MRRREKPKICKARINPHCVEIERRRERTGATDQRKHLLWIKVKAQLALIVTRSNWARNLRYEYQTKRAIAMKFSIKARIKNKTLCDRGRKGEIKSHALWI